MSDFPSSKYERGKIITKTGLKVGTNYAQRYLKNKVSGKVEDDRSFHQENAIEVFKEFTKLRGTALKIAQGMSMDQGLLPDEFAEVMSQAQYSVPPINKALVRSIIKRELGGYPEQLFATFDATAFAAASIGQVHKAELKDGRRVAIKIQYPNVRDTIDSDLVMAKGFAKRLVKKGSNIDPYFDEIRDTLLLETDYLHEGQQIEHFSKRFTHINVVTPQWIEEYSTSKVLCMTFLDGRHLNEFIAENPTQEQRNHFGQLLWDFFHEQIIDHDYIHADTHPGNFLFMNDGRLGVIDFGCVKKFPVKFFRDYLELLPTHLKNDDAAIRSLFERLEVLKQNSSDGDTDQPYFEFAKNYGLTFSRPYTQDVFDFGDPDFDNTIRHFTKDAPLSNEPRGNKHFIYTTKVHVGLYNLLIKLKAQINTEKSKNILSKLLDISF
jgi:predicted unusual protein kinase regulating ubiquinone biosynthesis (AarF/ABC1/UbiB family)